jgi:type I restriction enzyme S subunit
LKKEILVKSKNKHLFPELYPLPKSWDWTNIADVGAYRKYAIVDGPFGSNLKVSDYVQNGPVPVLSTKNLEGNYDNVRYITNEKFAQLKRSAVFPGDILIAKIGSCGKTGIYPPGKPPAMIPANLIKISLNDNFELKYVYYYFNSPFFQKALKTIVKATAQPAFDVTNFKNIPLPFAPIDQQKNIVAEIEKQFSRLDEAVAGLKRAKANLKRYKAAILKSAVEGRITEQWRKDHPDVEPAEKLLQRILAERRAKWEQAELAKLKAKEKNHKDKNWLKKYVEPQPPDPENLSEIPPSWGWVRLETLSDIKGGITKDSQRKLKNGQILPYLRVANVQRGYLDLTEVKTIEIPSDQLKDLLLEKGDILFNEGGDRDKLGRGWVWEGEIEMCTFQNHIFRARPYLKEIPGKLFSWFGNSYGQKYFIAKGKQTTNLASINKTMLSAFPVPLPPVPEQIAIVEEVERLLTIISELEVSVDDNLKRSERLRQAILKKAFSGQLLENKRDEPLSEIGWEHYPFFNLRTGDIGKKQAGPKKKLDIYEIPS